MDRRNSLIISIEKTAAFILGVSMYFRGKKIKQVLYLRRKVIIAETFLFNSFTYKLDGFNLELNENLYPDIADKPYLWIFVLEFKSFLAALVIELAGICLRPYDPRREWVGG